MSGIKGNFYVPFLGGWEAAMPPGYPAFGETWHSNMPRRTVLTLQLGTRRVHLSGCTAHPTGEWVTQQARQLAWTLQDRQEEKAQQLPMRFLIRDRDAKFVRSFDTVLASEGIEIIKTPFRAPKANAYAERWVLSVREECLDRLLIINEGHLRRVVSEYTDYYNEARPHQGINQRCPTPINRGRRDGPVECRDVLSGIIHDYHREAA